MEKQLEEQLKNLEALISSVESKLTGFNSIEDRFIHEVNETFSPLIKLATSNFLKQNPSMATTFDHTDIEQDIFEYLLIWVMPKVKRFSTVKKVWMPYFRRTIQNCFVNISKKHFAKKRYHELDSSVDMRGIVDETLNLEETLIINDLVKSVKSDLSPTEAMILDHILEPPPDLLSYARMITKRDKIKITRGLLADYLGLPYSTISTAFNTFQKKFAEVL